MFLNGTWAQHRTSDTSQAPLLWLWWSPGSCAIPTLLLPNERLVAWASPLFRGLSGTSQMNKSLSVLNNNVFVLCICSFLATLFSPSWSYLLHWTGRNAQELWEREIHMIVIKKINNLNISPLAVITAIFSVVFHGVLYSFQYLQQKVMAHF